MKDSDEIRRAPQSGVVVHFSSRLLLGLCIFQFVLLILMALMNWGGQRPASPPSKEKQQATLPASSTNENDEAFYQGNSGPWGELEFARINIEPPDEFVAGEGRFDEKTKWFFSGYTRTQLTALFKATDLHEQQRAELLDAARWEDASDGIVVTPSDKLILEMNPQTRAQIYSILSESPRNDFQAWPCVFRNGGFDDWFQRSGLSEATLSLLRRMVYQRGATLCFSDVPQVVARIPTAAERIRLARTLSRNSTVLMKLRVRPDTDVQALMAYWGKGGRAKDLKPLIESLTMVPSRSVTIDVVHLMPPFARKRLNTYPAPDNSDHAPDCFWTAMNFFNDPPDDRYYDDAIWRAELKRDYEMVAEPAYGDLVFLLRPDGVPFHAAVYIADGVVFTKNGANYHQPWMLMKMEDLLARYPMIFSVRAAFFHPVKH